MNLFSPPVMLQAGSGLKSVGRIRIRSKMDRIRNTDDNMFEEVNFYKEGEKEDEKKTE